MQPALREMKDVDKGHSVMQIKLVALLQNWEVEALHKVDVLFSLIR